MEPIVQDYEKNKLSNLPNEKIQTIQSESDIMKEIKEKKQISAFGLKKKGIKKTKKEKEHFGKVSMILRKIKTFEREIRSDYLENNKDYNEFDELTESFSGTLEKKTLDYLIKVPISSSKIFLKK